jgi:hypothetical protein
MYLNRQQFLKKPNRYTLKMDPNAVSEPKLILECNHDLDMKYVLFAR